MLKFKIKKSKSLSIKPLTVLANKNKSFKKRKKLLKPCLDSELRRWPREITLSRKSPKILENQRLKTPTPNSLKNKPFRPKLLT